MRNASRDQQRVKVYRWENECVYAPAKFGECFTLKECRRLATFVRKAYGLEWHPFIIGDGRARRSACANSQGIKLPAWSRNPHVLAHELAHYICTRRGICDGHGPHFVRVYIDLLAWLDKQDESRLLKSARARGIKVAPRAKVPQRVKGARAPKYRIRADYNYMDWLGQYHGMLVRYKRAA